MITSLINNTVISIKKTQINVSRESLRDTKRGPYYRVERGETRNLAGLGRPF
jgi:hypothetical protein